MRTAYINKNNKVVYIAAFAEDKIKPNVKGKLLFNGEEVVEVDGDGLGLGDIYSPPVEPSPPALEEEIARMEAETKALEKELALDYAAEQARNDPNFEVWVEQKAKEGEDE